MSSDDEASIAAAWDEEIRRRLEEYDTTKIHRWSWQTRLPSKRLTARKLIAITE